MAKRKRSYKSMDYVREALNPNEKVVHIANFHWFYDAMSWFYLMFGVFLGMAALYGAAQVTLGWGVKKAFPDIDPSQKELAFEKVVAHYGGFFNVMIDLHWGIKLIAALIVLWGVITFISRVIVKYSTEICVTTNRMIYKRGFIARYVGELKLDRLESVNVWQGFFGRIFNFGRVIVHGVGVGNIMLPEIDDPIKFRKALDFARQKIYETRRNSFNEDIKDGKLDHDHGVIDEIHGDGI